VSTLKVNNLQVGQDGTAANNYTLYQPASPDGTVRLGYGVAGSVTDILTLKDSKLGIGTDNPVAKLQVLSGSGDQLWLDNAGERYTQISLRNNGTQKAALWLDETNDEFDLFAAAGYGIRFLAGGTEKLRINSNSQLLHTRSDDTTRYDLEFRQTGGITDGNYGGIHWTQGSTGSTNLGAIEIEYASTGRPDIVFKTRQSGGTAMSESLRITSAGLVGIGTDTPASRLHVHAPGSDLSTLRLSGTASNQVEYDIRQGIVGVNNAGFSIRDITNSATRFVISNTGNVGIGDGSPSDALTVYKSNVGNSTGITIRNTETSSTYSHARLRLESQNGAAYAHLWADVANTALRLGYNSSSTVNIYDNGKLTSPNQITAGTTFSIANVSGSIAGSGGGQDYIGLRHGTTFGLMLKTAGTNVGSVGIGVVDPVVQLDVKRSTAGTIARFYDTGSNGGALYNGGPIVGLSRVSNGSVSLDGPLFQVGIDKNSTSTYNIDETVFCVANDGVGIGTDNPNEELHIHASGTSYIRFTDEASGTGINDGVVIGLDHPHTYVWNYEAGDFVVATNATEKLRVKQDYIRTGGGSQTSNNGFIPLTFYSSATLSTGYRHGISTTFLGQIAPGNVGNAYLHAKIDVPGGAMWWVHSWGYTYSGGAIHNSQAVGYTYGSSIIATSVYNQNSNRALHIYRATDGNLVMRIYAAHGVSNAWGYFAFEGGFDGIVGNKPDHTLRILAYTWSASSAAQY